MKERRPEGGTRVELRRFLGGIPYSHERAVTPEERRALVKELVPCGVLILLLVVLMAGGASLARSSFELLGILVVLLGLAILYCVGWAWPHLQTLRSGRLYVYIGRMNDLAAFDVVQAHYRDKQGIIADHMDRYIEILATGKGDRLWRLEGVANQGALKAVRSRWLALVPDQDESGRRALTPEEAKEIRLRTVDFIAMGPFIWKQFVGICGAGYGLQFIELVGLADLFGITDPSVGLLYGLLAVVTLAVWIPYLKRLWFARTLLRDARAGIVEDGRLASGLPWVIEGEPARWRVGTAKGSTNGVTIKQAWNLEALARPLEEDDLEEYDEELASSTKA